ncbi:protein kinase superfamily protein [Striga asiatica]|uniref:Protein kinase superfamily protein n=1 Tax=Striga asiatica TaxID=4170 RepID=A0A5A7QVD9_STRAF|nr:protein kinase superfamily protein [Striga asiatica]
MEPGPTNRTALHEPSHSPASPLSSSSSSSSSSGPYDRPKSRHGPEPGPTSPACPWSMVSASPPPDYWAGPDGPVGYDPNRIPASIFSARPVNPADWSAASNESLFSIHMGNSSFSHDHAILYAKSGELGRLDEWAATGLPTVMEGHAHEDCGSSLGSEGVSRVESLGSVEKRGVTEEKKGFSGSESRAGPPAGSNLKSPSTPRTPACNARLSEESGNSGSSFAFPVLVSDGAKTGSLRRVKDIPQEPKLEAQVSKSAHKAPEQHRWFCRLCCWRRCC